MDRAQFGIRERCVSSGATGRAAVVFNGGRMTEPERRIAVGNTLMTRSEVLAALESNVGFAKESAAALLRYLGRPSTPEQEQIVREAQRVQGYIGGVLTQLVRALREDE